MPGLVLKQRSTRWCTRFAIVSMFAVGPVVPAVAATEIVIGTGSLYGVYYRVGRAVCGLVNRNVRDVNCSAVPTAGSLANLRGLRDGSFDIAVVQSDAQYHAVEGSGPFSAGAGAYNDLRALFSVHGEPFTLVARQGSGISSLRDLAGRRINIGDPGSGQRATTGIVMAAMGWTPASFSLAAELPVSQQSLALCNDEIDAMVYVVGHPNESVKRATELCQSTIVEVAGPEIDVLVTDNPFYSYMEIPGDIYAGNREPVKTFGVRATVVTSKRLKTREIYAIVKTVFENLDQLRATSVALQRLEAREMTRVGLSAPLHKGAARYFRKAGLN